MFQSSEGIFNQIDVFQILQRKISDFEKISAFIFLMTKFEQKKYSLSWNVYE